MFGLHIVDALVLIAYLIGITILGAWAAKLVRNMGEFFMPRRFGKAMLAMHGFGTGTHSDHAVGVATKTVTDGLSGIWYQWLWLFVTPFYWLIAPMMRRFRAITTADVFETRYDGSVAGLFALFGMLQMISTIGLVMVASVKVLVPCLGDEVDPDWILVAMAVMFMIYGVAGGLAGAILTDFIQGLLSIVFSVILVVPLFQAVGGFDAVRSAIATAPEALVPDGMNAEKYFNLQQPGGIGIFYIAVIALNALIGVVAQPHIMGNCAAGRTEMDGRVGFTIGNFLKRFCTVAWCLTGLLGLAYFLQEGVNFNWDPQVQNPATTDPHLVYGMVAKRFLPVGVLGVFLASLLALVMGSCDSFMIASSALFTENIYKRLAPRRSDRHYLWVGRAAAFAVVVVGVLYALWLRERGVIAGLEIFWKIAAMTAIAFWLGLFWRRATVAGAWAATITAVAIWWGTAQGWFVHWIADKPRLGDLPWVVDEAMYKPWPMVFYLVGGVLVGVVVSILTPRVRREKLDRFYTLIRTPVKTAEDSPPVPCTLPEGVQPAPRRVLLPWKNWEVPVPSVLSVVGFLACWAAVAGLIAIFYWIAAA